MSIAKMMKEAGVEVGEVVNMGSTEFFKTLAMVAEAYEAQEKAEAEESVEDDNVFTFAEVLYNIEAGEEAVSLTDETVVFTLSPNGGLVHARSGETIGVSPLIMNSEYYLRERPQERRAVPMHVALSAYHEGKTIELEYEGTSVDISRESLEEERPFIHFDAFVHGIYYIVD